MKKKIKKEIVLREDDFRESADGGFMFRDLIVEPLELPANTDEVVLVVVEVRAY
jgi:hypothetical protein